MDSSILRGKISFDSVAFEGVNVLNLTNKRVTTSDKDGLFFLFAKEGDVLVFSAVNLVTLRRRVDKNDLSADIVSIQMTAESIELKEVVIDERT